MSDYYSGNNRKEEIEQKLMNKIYDWWDSMSEQEQYDLMQDWYPNQFKEDDDGDSFFGDMPDGTKLWIYQRENKITDEDIEGQRDREYDWDCHRKMVEGGEKSE